MAASWTNEFPQTPETPEERRQRRRARRWKRRARLFGPFLGLPLLVGTLALSVDLIEYVPKPAPERLSDRPIPTKQLDQARANRATRPSAANAPVIDAKNVPTTASLNLGVSLEADDRIALEREFAAPKPPYALRGRR